MRETVRSLSIYFVVIALLSLTAGFMALLLLPFGVNSLHAFLALPLGVAYLFVGVRLRVLLTESPRVVLGLILTGGFAGIASFFVGLFAGTAATTEAPRLFIGLAITWYLYANVRRLSTVFSANAQGVT